MNYVLLLALAMPVHQRDHVLSADRQAVLVRTTPARFALRYHGDGRRLRCELESTQIAYQHIEDGLLSCVMPPGNKWNDWRMWRVIFHCDTAAVTELP